MGKLQMRRSKTGERTPGLPSPSASAPAAVRRSATEPGGPGPDLQRAALLGHNIQRLAAGRIQPKLTLGPVGDRYEQEADGVARQVMQQISSPQPAAVEPAGGGAAQGMAQRAMPGLDEEDVKKKPLPGAVQRAAPPLNEEDVKKKPLPGAVQRAAPPLNEEDLKKKPLPGAVQRQGGSAEGGPLGADVERSIDGARSGGRSLDSEVRAKMEPAFGADFGGVRVHSDAKADGLNRSLQARAFTTGQDIFFRGGEYNPKSSGGQELLAHELTHVVQQNGGAVAKKPEERDRG